MEECRDEQETVHVRSIVGTGHECVKPPVAQGILAEVRCSPMVQIEVATPKDRFVAAAIDFVPPFLLFVALAAAGQSGGAAILALFASVYLIFRDLVGNGQSIGKRVCSLQVVDSETDRVPEPMALIFRNVGFGVPGLNAVYAIVEGIRVLQHPQGLRFGDVFASTGVVKVPAEEREKLLIPKKDRPSRESKIVTDAPLEGAAAEASAAAAPPADGAAAVPAAPKADPSVRPKPKADAASGGRPVVPPKEPAKPPVSMDLPADASAAATAPAAPAPEAAGVALSADDPLKKLIDQATAKK